MQQRNKYWNISPEVGQFLYDLILENNYKTILEIGTSNAYSGIWIAKALKETNGHLYTIESHKERYALAQKNIQDSGLSDYITSINGHAPEAIPENIKFDMAFFDATKYEHIEYFEKIKDQINPKGMIITDNITTHKEQLAQFIETISSLKNWSSEKIPLDAGLLLSRKLS